MDASQEIYAAGQEIASASGSSPSAVLNRTLNRFLGWPFRAATGSACDHEGRKTERFASIVYTASEPDGPTETIVSVPADRLAAAIDVCEQLDLESFRAAYGRIVSAKTLKKTLPPRALVSGTPQTTTTLGIILATHSSLSLEELAKEFARLNRGTPSEHWPDMVAISSVGTINYVAHFPGQQALNDLLPPAQGALANYIPPIYVVLILKNSGMHTFNRVLGLLFGHLPFFSLGAKVPNFVEITREVPKIGMPWCGYQYNLKGKLLPVPRELYNDRYLPPRPFRIEDRKGNLLGALQFVPWQDGGVLILKGQIPLQRLIAMLGRGDLRNARVSRIDERQISNVLPISQADFGELLGRIQRQSNVVVRTDPTELVLQKFADEGTSSPFIARLFLGVMQLRDAVFPDPTERQKFDKAYNGFDTFLGIRNTAKNIVTMWKGHVDKVASGEIVVIRGSTIEINNSIDKELRKEVESFLNSSVRTLKGMQNVAQLLKVNIGFLFKKPGAFAKGVSDLERTDPALAEYLRQSRAWSERLITIRNDVEHDGLALPRVAYSRADDGKIRMQEPQLSGQTVSEFVMTMLDRLSCFVEEVTVHCLQKQMPAGVDVTEIPLADRDGEETAVRFRLMLTLGGRAPWAIAYHEEGFEQT
jgi:hypothetical protein